MYCQSCGEKLPSTIKVCPCGGTSFSQQPVNLSPPPTDNFTPKSTTSNPSVTPPIRSASSMQYAGFWRRFGAYLIDVLILLVPILIVVVPIATNGNEEIVEYTDIIFAIVYLFYGAILNCSERQATFGKRAMGLWVFDDTGQRLTFGKSFARSLTFAFVAFLSFIMLFTERKQAVHDLVARTVVLHSPE